MSNEVKEFKTETPSASFTSSTVHFSSRGVRTGVFQANPSTGDTVRLQGRVQDDCPWVDILEISDAPTIIEVITCPQMQIIVSNASTNPVSAYITR
jgi:hypothetical protein